MHSWVIFLVLLLLFLALQAFFTMSEMAFVSFNRVRLQYYVGKDNKKAIWLSRLLNRPTYLFGTTLIGVNVCLQFGSECARRFYTDLGLNPDLAPATQIALVVIFAELAPMFAARTHAEHVSMLSVRWIYYLSKLMKPIIWVLDCICALIDRLLKSPPAVRNYLTRDELQMAIGSKETAGHEEFDQLIHQVFSLKMKRPKDLMIPIRELRKVPSDCKVANIKHLLSLEFSSFIAIYSQTENNIFGFVYIRDLLKLPDHASIRDCIRTPWFITEKNSLYQILKQFRTNSQHNAIVLDENGLAIGMLTLNSIVRELFQGSTPIAPLVALKIAVDRSFIASTKVREINRDLGIELPHTDDETLEELMTRLLGHYPAKLERVRCSHFELFLEETPLLSEKKIRVISG